MANLRTGAEHIKSLKDGRAVYIDGELVADVTEHPAFRNAVLAAAELYDFQAQPENVELMTFQPDGSNRRVNRGWQMPRNYEELVQRRKALQAWAAPATTTFTSATSSSIRRPSAARIGASRPRTWSPASSTRIPPASPSAAPRCSAPARSWPTSCWSPTCSR